MHAERLIERTEARRAHVSDAIDVKRRAGRGQFFTPAPVAGFLAGLIDLPERQRMTILDPGAGVGSLAAAVIARAIAERTVGAIHIVAFESDSALLDPLTKTLRDCERTAFGLGLDVTTEVRACDFLAWASGVVDGSMWATPETFDACVMNPPYRKVNTGSPERFMLERIGLRVTNLYTAFMGAAAALLSPGGQMSAITPRSFANGPYFLPFRQFFLARMALDRLHVYEKRGRLFADTDVLQENVVLAATREGRRSTIALSTSRDESDEPPVRRVPYSDVVRPDDPQLFIHIPVDERATRLASQVAILPSGLPDLGIEVSTGRVVDFRARHNLVHDPAHDCAPLIYPSHLAGGRVMWPALDGRKPNALALSDETAALVLPAGDYALVKRFSAKEERRRVVASWFRPVDIPGTLVAFENHLNVFHRRGAGLDPALAAGLTLFLNTTILDAYVRQFSGHTQINATDLRLLRYPDLETLLRLGAIVETKGWPRHQEAIDELVRTVVVALEVGAGDVRAA